MSLRKWVSLSLDMFYTGVYSFKGPLFQRWKTLTNVKHPNNFLKFNINDHICIEVKEKLMVLHVQNIRRNLVGAEYEDELINHLLFYNCIYETRVNLRKICTTLTNEIHERFQRDYLLESMAVINPKFWNIDNGEQLIYYLFCKYMVILGIYFGKTV